MAGPAPGAGGAGVAAHVPDPPEIVGFGALNVDYIASASRLRPGDGAGRGGCDFVPQAAEPYTISFPRNGISRTFYQLDEMIRAQGFDAVEP